MGWSWNENEHAPRDKWAGAVPKHELRQSSNEQYEIDETSPRDLCMGLEANSKYANFSKTSPRDLCMRLEAWNDQEIFRLMKVETGGETGTSKFELNAPRITKTVKTSPLDLCMRLEATTDDITRGGICSSKFELIAATNYVTHSDKMNIHNGTRMIGHNLCAEHVQTTRIWQHCNHSRMKKRVGQSRRFLQRYKEVRAVILRVRAPLDCMAVIPRVRAPSIF